MDLTDQPKPVFYVPYLESPQSTLAFVIRTAKDPSSIVSALRERILAIDPNQSVYNIRTMDQVFSNSIESSRLNMLVLSIFAGIATLVALVGIYGVISYSVNQRSQEIGIRLALGAGRSKITVMILRHALLLVSIGIGLGLLMAAGLVRFLDGLLYEVKPFDITVFIAVVVLLSATAMFTSFLSALRAGRIDPYTSLRYQ
ncbi:MAG TPA: FtsX-like permease family protein [Candidatus Angelobacter sp.]|nr:FtsX-like permease family protein [Candidatus Angelobacter sp.]